MASGGGEIVVQLQLHSSRRWLVVNLQVGEDAVLSMIVNPAFPVSTITITALDDLLSRGLARAVAARTYRLQEIRAQGQRLPDIQVRPRPGVSGFRVDGILGFDFATNFTDVCLNVPTLRLTLRP